tara:strand:+ start:20559 stop:23327 length:2769 start_codon:yes stop_codon:yes gene_type:complete
MQISNFKVIILIFLLTLPFSLKGKVFNFLDGVPFTIQLNSDLEKKFILYIYNNNYFNEIDLYSGNSIEINLTSGRYTLSIKSGNHKNENIKINVLDKLPENIGISKNISINIIQEEKDNNVFYAQVNYSNNSEIASFNVSSKYNYVINVANEKYTLKNIYEKYLYSKYKILLDNNKLQFNEIYQIRLIKILNEHNRLLSNFNSPISIWKLVDDTMENEISYENDNLIVQLKNKLFNNTYEELNNFDTGYHIMLENVVREYIIENTKQNKYQNMKSGILFYSLNSDNEFKTLNNISNINPNINIDYYEENELENINAAVSIINKKSKILKDVKFIAKFKGTTYDYNNIISTIPKSLLLLPSTGMNVKELNSIYIKKYINMILQASYRDFKDFGYFQEYLNLLKWGINANGDWSNNKSTLNIAGFDNSNPESEYYLLMSYYLKNNTFPPLYIEHKNYLLKYLNITSDLPLDKKINNINVNISGEDHQNKSISVNLELLNTVIDGKKIIDLELGLKNNLNENLILYSSDDGNTLKYISDGTIEIKNKFNIKRDKINSIFHISTYRAFYSDGSIGEIRSFNKPFAFSIINSFQDATPPEIDFNSFNINIEKLANFDNEITFKFKVFESNSINPEMNSYLQILYDGEKSIYKEVFGYGIDTGDTGYDSSTGEISLKSIIPRYYPSGDYYVNGIEVYDANNNTTAFYGVNSSLDLERLKFNITNSNPDIRSPEISSDNIKLQLEESSDVNMMMGNLVLYLNVVDDNSGVGDAVISYTEGDELIKIAYLKSDSILLENLNKNEKNLYNIALPIYTESLDNIKNIVIENITVYDLAFNKTELTNLLIKPMLKESIISNEQSTINYNIDKNYFDFNFQTYDGNSYVIQSSIDLKNWINVQKLSGGDGNYSYQDSEEIGNNVMKFYRVKNLK